jgi:dTDP-4-amino-4,6-dideoxy-D-galactose acyltransferase
MPETAPCHRLAWDSDFFGFPVAIVEGHRLTPRRAIEIVAWCRREAVRCLYFLAQPDDPGTRRLAEEQGFEFQDSRITLAVESPVGKTLAPGPEEALIRSSRRGDLEQLRRIAARAYRDSRFYRDRHFDPRRCDELYAGWIESICRREPQSVPVAELLVAERDGCVEGYIDCEWDDSGRGRIGLTAVQETSQGQGLGRQLVAAALRWFAERSAASVTAITQGRNVRSQRLFQRCGFAVSGVQWWYHWWSDG